MIEKAILQVLNDAIEKDGLDPETALREFPEAWSRALPEVARTLLQELLRRSSRQLKLRRKDESGFRRRNFSRWRKGFDLLEVLIAIAEEAGIEFNEQFRPNAVEAQDFTFEALVSLHSRAVLISKEILCLLQGGFPDGALARWRSLHEVAVTATFLAENSVTVAERYLASFHVQALKTMIEYRNYAERANLTPLDDQEIENARQTVNELRIRHGEDVIDRAYGWAIGPLSKSQVKKGLKALEESTGLDHWRPRYSWASQYVHANYKPPGTLLGTSETDFDESVVLLSGPSNSGMTEPAQMMALSLANATTALILHEHNLDRQVVSKVILQLSTEIGQTFWNIERKTLEEHRRNLNGD